MTDLFGAPYQPHSATSRAAAREIVDGCNALERRVLEALAYYRDNGMTGATDQQIQGHTGMDANTQRPRRVRLVEKGLVRDSGEKRPTLKRRKAVVWELTE